MDTDADDDGDGLSDFLEYVFGTNAQVANSKPYSQSVAEFTVDGVTKNYLTFTMQVSQHSRNAVSLVPEVTNDLNTWDSMPSVVKVSETDQGDGTYSLVYRSATAIEDNGTNVEFIRILVSQ